MMYTIYVLRCTKDGSLYVGMTNSLDRRLAEHQSGYVKYTKSRLPVALVYTEKTVDRKDARTREKKLKSGAGKEFLKNIIPR